MSGFRVLQPGLMTLITDRGRFGHHRIGLTTGGPLDPLAFDWANRLLGNDANATGLEISIGGLVLEAQVDTWIVLTGGELPLKINGKEQERWCALPVRAGDRVEAGFSTAGAPWLPGGQRRFSDPPHVRQHRHRAAGKTGGTQWWQTQQ